mgnify:CR=1 FL=1
MTAAHVFCGYRETGRGRTWYVSVWDYGILEQQVYRGRFVETLLTRLWLMGAAELADEGYLARYAGSDGRQHALRGSVRRHTAAILRIGAASAPRTTTFADLYGALVVLLAVAARRRACVEDLEC